MRRVRATPVSFGPLSKTSNTTTSKASNATTFVHFPFSNLFLRDVASLEPRSTSSSTATSRLVIGVLIAIFGLMAFCTVVTLWFRRRRGRPIRTLAGKGDPSLHFEFATPAFGEPIPSNSAAPVSIPVFDIESTPPYDIHSKPLPSILERSSMSTRSTRSTVESKVNRNRLHLTIDPSSASLTELPSGRSSAQFKYNISEAATSKSSMSSKGSPKRSRSTKKSGRSPSPMTEARNSIIMHSGLYPFLYVDPAGSSKDAYSPTPSSSFSVHTTSYPPPYSPAHHRQSFTSHMKVPARVDTPLTPDSVKSFDTSRSFSRPDGSRNRHRTLRRTGRTLEKLRDRARSATGTSLEIRVITSTPRRSPSPMLLSTEIATLFPPSPARPSLSGLSRRSVRYVKSAQIAPGNGRVARPLPFIPLTPLAPPPRYIPNQIPVPMLPPASAPVRFPAQFPTEIGPQIRPQMHSVIPLRRSLPTIPVPEHQRMSTSLRAKTFSNPSIPHRQLPDPSQSRHNSLKRTNSQPVSRPPLPPVPTTYL